MSVREARVPWVWSVTRGLFPQAVFQDRRSRERIVDSLICLLIQQHGFCKFFPVVRSEQLYLASSKINPCHEFSLEQNADAAFQTCIIARVVYNGRDFVAASVVEVQEVEI